MGDFQTVLACASDPEDRIGHVLHRAAEASQDGIFRAKKKKEGVKDLAVSSQLPEPPEEHQHPGPSHKPAQASSPRS